MAEDKTTPNADLSAPEGGQIALTARNDLDGTWSITRGPGGDVLDSGLQRDEALAIVGAPTGPYEPANEQEAVVAEKRRALEDKAAKMTNEAAFEPDEEPAPRRGSGGSRATPSAKNTANAKQGNGEG